MNSYEAFRETNALDGEGIVTPPIESGPELRHLNTVETVFTVVRDLLCIDKRFVQLDTTIWSCK